MRDHFSLILFFITLFSGMKDVSSQNATASPQIGNQGGFRGATVPITDVRFIFKTEVPAHPQRQITLLATALHTR